MSAVERIDGAERVDGAGRIGGAGRIDAAERVDAIARFGAIGLDALVSEAALMTRVDRKYLVPLADLDAIIALLPRETVALEIDGARNFAYESVYFDTPDLLSFTMAARPRRRRFKIRTRSYVDTGGTYLEIKTRGARGTTVKERTPYAAPGSALTDEALACVAEAFEAIGVDESRSDELGATLITRYDRATLLAPDRVARTTIDTGLVWERPDGSGIALPTMAIVETKSPSQASLVDRLLWRHGHRPASISKYATGLAACTPGIARNRWARVLRGPFAAAVPFDSPVTSSTDSSPPHTSFTASALATSSTASALATSRSHHA